EECVYFSRDNLESLLEYYLEHEDERRAVAEVTRIRVAGCRSEDLWQATVDQIEARLPTLRERVPGRARPAGQDDLRVRIWQAMTSSQGRDPNLLDDLRQAIQANPQTAFLHS